MPNPSKKHSKAKSKQATKPKEDVAKQDNPHAGSLDGQLEDLELEPLPVPKKHHPHRILKTTAWLVFLTGVLAVALYIGAHIVSTSTGNVGRNLFTKVVAPKQPQPRYGVILDAGQVTTLDATATSTLIRQTNKTFSQPAQATTRQLIRYTSSDEEGREVAVYARVYKPKVVPAGSLAPIFAFAPGTTGIDDRCAASLEQPQKSNWANYDSHMAAYANAGYTVVITDYEGMRDASRMHHYMVGNLEGRAMLDSIRALSNLSSTKDIIDKKATFVAGYSQGGHAALWADKIAAEYAPELQLSGVVGFGPVSDVETTLADNTRGANINWFGPFVLYSYGDYYHRGYDLSQFLLPRWQQSITTDIATNCIDTLIPHWGKVSSAVYQPQFLLGLSSGNLSGNFNQLSQDMAKNQAGNTRTDTPKLINHGQLDNVVLVSQSEALRTRLCSLGGGTVTKKVYPTATHYDTMVKSFNDTLVWMLAIRKDQPVSTSCSQ